MCRGDVHLARQNAAERWKLRRGQEEIEVLRLDLSERCRECRDSIESLPSLSRIRGSFKEDTNLP